MSVRESSLLTSQRGQLEKLFTSVRGKLQFMDYLVRAAVADLERYEAEADPGTRIFLRQLIEMHASNLTLESENMRLVDELCQSLDEAVGAAHDSHETGGAA
jgi:hypothetical protein